tara:strand:- start:503 stop:1111 length:609 start_codon:yes stop_codon:yes gene_type:complete
MKILIRITHFLLLPFALVLLFPEVALSNKVYVSVTTTNIRSGPGLEHSIIAVAKTDQVLTILKEEKEWLNVSIPSGKEGWISRKMVKAEKPKSITIAEHKDTIDRQRSQIEESKKNFAAMIKKNEKLSFQLEKLKLSQDQLIKDNKELKNSGEKFMFIGLIIAGLIIWFMGFLAGHFWKLSENKRFAKMSAVAQVPKYEGNL